MDGLVQPGRPDRHRRRHRFRRRQLRQLVDRHADPVELRDRLRQRLGDPRFVARERPAPDDGRAAGHPARPQHRRHQDRGPAQRRLGVVAHRHRARHRRGALPDQLRQGPRRHQPLRRRAAGHDRQRVAARVQPRARRRLRRSDRLPLLAAPGAVDLHRLRRLRPCGRGDGRRPTVERLGRLHLGRRLRRRRLHRPVRPGHAPAPARPDHELQTRPRRACAAPTTAATRSSSPRSATTWARSATGSAPPSRWR